jgi:hypothetical protein
LSVRSEIEVMTRKWVCAVLLLMKGRFAHLDVAVSVTSQTRSNSRTLTPSPPSVPVIRSLVDRLLESQGPALGARRLGPLVGKAPAGFGQALLMGYPKHWGHRPRAGPGERLDCAKDLGPRSGSLSATATQAMR